MASSTPKSSKRDLWFKFGRFITGVTIACFFLPFFGVSCDGMEVVHVSGADMVGGCKPGGMLTEPTKEYKGDRRGEPVVKVENVDREPLAIAALGLAVVVFGLSWVRSRGAMIAAFALSLACIGALAGLYVKVGGTFDEQIDQQMKKETSGSALMKDVNVESGSRFGLWLTVGGLLGIAALTGLALWDPEHAPLSPSGPPPA